MNVVFDTNVLISSTLYAGSVSQKLLFKLIRSGAVSYSSADILDEYQRVLKRDFDYSDDECEHIMEKVLSFITIVIPKRKINAVRDDPDDNKIIECALEASCKHILSYDKHLLNLKDFAGIKIMTPDKFMRLIDE